MDDQQILQTPLVHNYEIPEQVFEINNFNRIKFSRNEPSNQRKNSLKKG